MWFVVVYLWVISGFIWRVHIGRPVWVYWNIILSTELIVFSKYHLTDMVRSWDRSTPKLFMLDWDFPWNKPSSEFGVPPWRAGNPQSLRFDQGFPSHGKSSSSSKPMLPSELRPVDVRSSELLSEAQSLMSDRSQTDFFCQMKKVCQLQARLYLQQLQFQTGTAGGWLLWCLKNLLFSDTSCRQTERTMPRWALVSAKIVKLSLTEDETGLPVFLFQLQNWKKQWYQDLPSSGDFCDKCWGNPHCASYHWMEHG